MLWLLGITFSVSATEMTVAYRVHTDDISRATRAIIAEVMNRVDPQIELQWIEMPLKRAERSIEKGIIDIDINRTKLAYIDSDKVVYASTPLYEIDYYLYARTYVLEPSNYRRVAIKFGDSFALQVADKYQWQVSLAPTEVAAMTMVQNQRVQAMLGFGAGLLNSEQGKELTSIRRSQEPVETVNLYMVFHRRHSAKANLASQVIKNMIDSGDFAAIYIRNLQ
ncbi:hypothetical protein BZJ17_02905 [Salinivibrio sp. IB574]|uniref:substrate-binding periplasmic protein n=1 Tax=Salinivibrio sp. IB574 TaxID=1909444 RepID=UPI0009894EEE|nr:transporter substrate-binding domain-containing protein [Salinivibrio sp. IB574]OOF23645.1 hypothetical protein BZJ17_02905 [Salinivibrio sp. IB574]